MGLAVAVLWAVLGGACFFTGAQWVYESWGTSLNTTLIIDVVFLAGVLVVIRLYGGIHFRAAIERGLEQGRCIGAFTNALRTRR